MVQLVNNEPLLRVSYYEERGKKKNYLNTIRDGSHDMGHHSIHLLEFFLSKQRSIVVISSKLAHDKQGPAEKRLAIYKQFTKQMKTETFLITQSF
jgi:hypothetical protein